jgi:hypothetical protein
VANSSCARLQQEIQLTLTTIGDEPSNSPLRRAPIYLSPQELSARWEGRITVKTLANWRSDSAGRGPRFKRFGNRILYLVADVETFEAESSFVSTRDYPRG